MVIQEQIQILEDNLKEYVVCNITIEEYNYLKENLEKADKYRRHDLRKNPEDLPEGHTDCLIWIKTLNNIRARVAFYNGKEFILHRNQNQSQVLAWKYIEPFDEVEECQ